MSRPDYGLEPQILEMRVEGVALWLLTGLVDLVGLAKGLDREMPDAPPLFAMI